MALFQNCTVESLDLSGARIDGSLSLDNIVLGVASELTALQIGEHDGEGDKSPGEVADPDVGTDTVDSEAAGQQPLRYSV